MPGYRHKDIVLVGGCFDIVHYGHVLFLEEARKKGEILFVALESDEFIRQIKKRKPVHTQKQRANMLASLRVVTCVVVLPYFAEHKEYGTMVKLINPNTIAITEGDDKISYKLQHAAVVGAEVVEVTPRIEGVSTSAILKQI